MVQSALPYWGREQLKRVQEAHMEPFSDPEQKRLEDLRIDQINNGEGMVVNEATRQRLIQERFPYPIRWLHQKNKTNADPTRFNMRENLTRNASDFQTNPMISMGLEPTGSSNGSDKPAANQPIDMSDDSTQAIFSNNRNKNF